VTSRRYRPVTDLPEVLAARLDRVAADNDHPLRVALDGPPGSGADELADEVVSRLRVRGRFAAAIRVATFWRDASLRLEHGRFDVDAFRDWIDVAALDREVLRPLGPHGSRVYLPSLRDPSTNRATHAAVVPAPDGAVGVISGGLLLGRGLPFDVTIHLAVSAAARRRRTGADWSWTLPAFDAYDHEVEPVRVADVVVRLDDPQHPAISTS
jgi:hypothetical protein